MVSRLVGQDPDQRRNRDALVSRQAPVEANMPSTVRDKCLRVARPRGPQHVIGDAWKGRRKAPDNAVDAPAISTVLKRP